jgi:hypothetical protein
MTLTTVTHRNVNTKTVRRVEVATQLTSRTGLIGAPEQLTEEEVARPAQALRVVLSSDVSAKCAGRKLTPVFGSCLQSRIRRR